jgi:acetate kinase
MADLTDPILVLNAGSSTLKASLVAGGTALATTEIAWPAGGEDAGTAPGIVEAAGAQLGGTPVAVGYRVVHGGADGTRPLPVDDALVARIEALDPLAPLHNRRAAAVIGAGRVAFPDIPHVACFDTAFHATLPEVAWRYPLPADWVARWELRRYGFHGLSVTWAVRRAAELLARPAEDIRLVVAHLGSGASVTAVDGGRSVDTSMGYTPAEGLMMGTRAGSVDPGFLVHLAAAGVAPDELGDGLAHRSGLLAIGGTNDVRALDERASRGDEPARLALAMFAHRAAAGIAAVATSLERLDALVFTGGIGEHSATVRQAIVDRLATLGVPAELSAATADDAVLAAGPPAVLVVAAREDLVVAAQVVALLGAADAAGP